MALTLDVSNSSLRSISRSSLKRAMNDDSDRRRRDLSGPDLRPLSAFTDNELSAAERAAMLVRVTTDAGAAGRVADYCAQRSALAALFGDSREDTRCIVVRRRAPRWQHAGLAASCMAIGVALGWSPGWISANFAVDRPVFAERADIAFAVYAPEQRHPAAVSAFSSGIWLFADRWPPVTRRIRPSRAIHVSEHERRPAYHLHRSGSKRRDGVLAVS
jgi:anti-sigma factor RsiW